ncbi:MAG TPA: hypothetical protein VE615_03035 [Gaiellaceae bacterium]|jgi:hypothetical protein|nr:hypothetical protein [Gaiellaceae bacterium]
MRFYPDIPARRASALARDLLTVLVLILFAWIALKVHDAVDRLAVLGQGVNEAGSSVENGFDAAADAVDDTPLVGGEIADGLRDAGEGSGGNVADLGRAGEEKTHKLADLLGLVVFALPSAFLLLRVVPPRVAEIRRLNAAARVLEPDGPERERLLAMRAAFALPYGQLLRHTRDPLGDLEAGRHEPLVRAVLEDAGLRPPAR